MVTTRSRGAVAPERTSLQLQRDHIVSLTIHSRQRKTDILTGNANEHGMVYSPKQIAPPQSSNNIWQAQHDTLFKIDLQSHDRCTLCGSVYDPEPSKNTFLSVGVNPDHTSITQAIFESLQEETRDTLCERCQSNQNKTRWTEIIAAPKILRIHLQILLHDVKLFHTLNYPDVLDLTAFQEAPALPLQYQLSSVVAHSGDYVNEDEATLELIAMLRAESEADEDARFARELQAQLDAEIGLESQEENGNQDDDEDDSENGDEDEDTDQAEESDQARATAKKPIKHMRGHYIASVREPDGTFSSINDSSVASITHAEFLANPQQSQDQAFQVYVLTYIRDDSVRCMDKLSKRWYREMQLDSALGTTGTSGTAEEMRWPRTGKGGRLRWGLDEGGDGEQARRGTKRKRVKRG
ncbi:hypothetical protein EJ07DRAFT_172862 [Lizonia empirigonia]|nr:hypothetical protein EJ07DRAFT_172862 [Lizonia empirigonia]